MKKLLDIPLVTQPKGTLECGAACTKMILNYHGHDVSYDTINNAIPVRDGFGLYIYEIGSYLISLGYETTITGLNTNFANIKMIDANSHVIKDHIQAHQKDEYYAKKWEKFQDGFGTLFDFIDQGGQLATQITSEKTIKNHLDADQPVLVALTSNFLYDKIYRHNEHFALITGYDDNNFYMNDPGYYNPEGQKQIFSIEQTMYAIHANTAPSVEGGMILTVKPRSLSV